MPSTLFIDPLAGELGIDSVAYEANPVALVGGVAFVPVALAALLGPSALAGPFALAGQFVLAGGAPSCFRASSAPPSSPTTPRDRSRS